jgi:AraC family transcriptional regulator of adaptative response/methylated-DNA-[protein]-cysteine methyltransferase
MAISYDSDLLWDTVLRREPPPEAGLVYAVLSTGIYCLFSCPSRRPAREQARFFSSCDDAESAGFRECQRCRPRTGGVSADLAARICRYIDKLTDEPVHLSDLSRRFGISTQHLQRTFKRVVGVTPRAYAAAQRMERLKAGLKNGLPVGEAIVEAGYGSTSRVYERAAEQIGMSPKQYRRGGSGLHIDYATATTPLGKLMVAATDRGVCAVALGESDEELVADLRGEFPEATIQPDIARLTSWMEALMRHLDGSLPDPALPMDIQGTAFQHKVWQALREIPYGQTRSYSQIASAIGQPTGARAIARACATNPAALIIPCHRVVGAGGDLSGYRWGVDRKRELIRREKGEEDLELALTLKICE